MGKQRVLSEAQRACFYKFEPDTNLKECEKLSGSQFDVFDEEFERHQRKNKASKGLALNPDQKIRMDKLLDKKMIRDQGCHLADYDLSF